ncbi:uncharacterized protein LOC129594777 [Paramacrobiotus metropolitanus]|uniref:uncharacterized protein LOC129594777 n=1 Tax=Paramacrobiotus metropolitanus TaxID=2943436 RepID=UPI0024459EF1|nr:uncharacterized protein LOC129594777 [Paramacrobiotus metropolitanus]
MATFIWITVVVLVQIALSTVTADLNRLKSLNVKCGDNDMLVDIEFNTPFNGIIFSKGYFARSECVYVKAAPAKYSYQFTIAYSGCGTTAGGSGIAGGTRRSDGFLRSSDEVLPQESNTTTNATRTRRDIPTANVTGAQARSLGGWGTGMGAEFMGDPYAPKMESQDLSAGSGSGYGDPMAAGQMGTGGSGQYWQPGPANTDYSGGMPGMNMNNGGYGGGQPVQYTQYNNYPQNNMNGAVMWNGNSNGYGGQQQLPQQQQQAPPPPNMQNGNVDFNRNQNQGPAMPIQGNNQVNAQSQFQQNSALNAKVQGSANAASGANKFAASIPGTAKTNGQFSNQDQSDDGKEDEDTQSNTALRANAPFGEDKTGGSSRFFENIIIIQYDANIQEVWDVAKALRCEWHDNYHKTVSYKPFQVDSLEVVPATFAGDNVGVWMTVQQGKGPYAPEVNGIVRIGEYLTLAIGIQDQTKKFDMRVINCVASDGARPSVQLVDEYGCVTRPKIMSDIAKVTNYGDQASVVSYAYFQAFKFPDSVDVQLECSVEICKFGCAKQCYNKAAGETGSASKPVAVASIHSGLSFGGSSAAARGQLSRNVDGTLSESSASSSGEKATVSGKAASSSSSSKSASGSGSMSSDAAASGQKTSAGADANEDSVNSDVKKMMQEGRLIKITKRSLVNRATAAPGGSQGAALYNAMSAEDEDFNINDKDGATTKKPSVTAKADSSKRKSTKEPTDDDEPVYRKRRDAPVPDPEIQKNVGMKRRFRVVSPGDLSFLENKANNTVVYSTAQRVVGVSDVCISPTSFVAGIVVLLALLILTTLCAIILCLRLRSLHRISNKLKDINLDYVNKSVS